GVGGGGGPGVGGQEGDEGGGAEGAGPGEEAGGGGGGPAVGETVGDDEEARAAASVEEFGRVGRAPAGPAQHGGAGAREGDAEGADVAEGPAVLGGPGEPGDRLLPDPHGGGVVGEQHQVEGGGAGGPQERQPHPVGEALFGGGLLVEFVGVAGGHVAGELVQGAGEQGGAAAGAVLRQVGVGQ